jgi:hypothetical protein
MRRAIPEHQVGNGQQGRIPRHPWHPPLFCMLLRNSGEKLVLPFKGGLLAFFGLYLLRLPKNTSVLYGSGGVGTFQARQFTFFSTLLVGTAVVLLTPWPLGLCANPTGGPAGRSSARYTIGPAAPVGIAYPSSGN